PLMKCTWQEGNRITLLENGDNYYPAVFEAISHASSPTALALLNWRHLSDHAPLSAEIHL
ncbi:hypothetical protein, partial [Enterococcus faecium]|uniref:hypothetical protein n=1 Tax=Enterococcus faecium TaxID=1352 RepID=UPI00352817C0